MSRTAGRTHLEHARALLSLLEQETETLRSGAAEQVRRLCSAKLEELQPLQALLGAQGAAARQALDQAQRNTLRELLQACEQRNRTNEALLNARLNRSRQAVLTRRGAPAGYDFCGRGGYEAQRNWHGAA